jgi:hypothetical protein
MKTTRFLNKRQKGNQKMKSIRKIIANTVVGLIAVGMTLNFSGCSKEISPLFPNQEKVEQNSKMNKFTTDQISFLKAKTIRMKKAFNVSQQITVANGGTITVGDDSTGYSSIIFDPNDLNQDLTVDFNWDSQAFSADFGPHGSTFADTVVIRLSYKDADLGGIDEDDLCIWYYDENDQLWEMSGRIVNKTEKYVEGKTTHFSRYAVGGEP